MSAGTFTVLNVAKIKFLNGTINMASHAFKAALVTSSWSPSATWTGTSTNGQYSDITNEITGTGYTAGGVTLTTSLTSSSGTVTFGSSDATWTGTLTAKYIVVYDNTSANKDIVGYMDLDTSQPGGDSSTNGTFDVSFSSGLFSIA